MGVVVYSLLQKKNVLSLFSKFLLFYCILKSVFSGYNAQNRGYNAQNRGTMLKQGVQCSTRRVQCLKQRVQYSKHSSNRWVQCLKQRVQIFVRISQNFAKNAKTKRNRKKKICEKYICEYNFRELFNS